MQNELARQIASLPRRQTAAAALEGSLAVLVETLDAAATIANLYAPEHLSIQTERPESVLAGVCNAGSVFLGRYSPEAVGDYCSGTNHVLPTGGIARVQGGVCVGTFQKQMTVQRLTREGLRSLGDVATTLARAEGLEGAREGRRNSIRGAAMNPLPTHVALLRPYESARSLWKGDSWIFMDANESPFQGAAVLDGLPPMNRYPDPTADALRDAVSAFYGLQRGNLMMANGSDELIDLVVRAFVRPGRKVVSLSPSYGMYRVSADAAGLDFDTVPLRADFSVNEKSAGCRLEWRRSPFPVLAQQSDRHSPRRCLGRAAGGGLLRRDLRR